jgi:hypothetical protein
VLFDCESFRAIYVCVLILSVQNKAIIPHRHVHQTSLCTSSLPIHPYSLPCHPFHTARVGDHFVVVIVLIVPMLSCPMRSRNRRISPSPPLRIAHVHANLGLGQSCAVSPRTSHHEIGGEAGFGSASVAIVRHSGALTFTCHRCTAASR